MQDAADLNHIPILAMSVEDKMPGIVYDPDRSLGAVAAETDMVCPNSFFHEFRSLDGTVPRWLALDVADRLHDKSLVTQPSVRAKPHFAPYQCVAKIPACFGERTTLG